MFSYYLFAILNLMHFLILKVPILEYCQFSSFFYPIIMFYIFILRNSMRFID